MGFACQLGIGISRANLQCLWCRLRRLFHQALFQVTQTGEKCSGKNVYVIEKNLQICSTVQWKLKKKKKTKTSQPKTFLPPHPQTARYILNCCQKSCKLISEMSSTDISQMLFHFYDNEKGRKSRKCRFWDIKSPMLSCLEGFRSTDCSLFLS